MDLFRAGGGDGVPAENAEDSDDFHSVSGANFICEEPTRVEETSPRHVTSWNIFGHFLQFQTLLVGVRTLLRDRHV